MISQFYGKHGWLSNFYPCYVTLDNLAYRSIEHAYQAAKFTSPRIRAHIANIQSPGSAKIAARRYAKYVRPDWHEVNLSIMEDLLEQKFTQPLFRQKLLDTGSEQLVEGNTWGDTFWGVCDGEGENRLGKLIMKIRAEIKRGPTYKAQEPHRGRYSCRNSNLKEGS